MIIRKLGNGSNYASVTSEGSVVHIGDECIDCASEQQDSQRIIDLKIPGVDAYVATIVIPPKEYEPVEVEAIEDEEIEEGGMHVAPVVPQAKPLDIETVVVSLWPLDGIVIDKEETDNGSSNS